jgi:hypothetical protein
MFAADRSCKATSSKNPVLTSIFISGLSPGLVLVPSLVLSLARSLPASPDISPQCSKERRGKVLLPLT